MNKRGKFSLAVRAAVLAYEKSGRMLDAALAYAKNGFPVCPASVTTKKPIPARDPDPTGKFKDGIPGTGGIYKATTDPKQIHAWWDHAEYLIVLPMGERTGIWIWDIDTSEDHADGTSGWSQLIAQHGAFETREHRSATDGPHLVFHWSSEQPIRCSKGSLPSGMEAKGQGGYVAVPPSRRKGRSYTVYRDIDPIDPPPWLVDLILQGHGGTGSAGDYRRFDGTAEVENDELAEIMSFIPNEAVDWVNWSNYSLRVFAASGGQEWGFKIFDAWSQRCPQCFDHARKKLVGYDAANTRQRWEEIKGSPPNRTGIGILRKIAREHGWVPGLYAHAASYPDEGDYISPTKRAEIEKQVWDFLDNLIEPKRNIWIDDVFRSEWISRDHTRWLQWKFTEPSWPYESEPFNLPPIVWAMRVVTGGGKTSITIATIARWLQQHGREFTPLMYKVPTHHLAEKIKQQFIDLDIDARVFRGYLAPDPNNPINIERLKRDPNTPKEKLRPLCLMPERIEMAMRAELEIAEHCCKRGKSKCPYYDGASICPFRQQIPEKGDWPDVWIVASDMLFFNHAVFKDAKAVFADESFWTKGLRGFKDEDEDDDDEDDGLKVTLARLISRPKDGVIDISKVADHNWYRNIIGEALAQQPDNGGLDNRYFWNHIDPDICHKARVAEWKENERLRKLLGLYPGMPKQLFTLIKRELIDDMRLSRFMIRVWNELSEMLRHPEIPVSGRLWLEKWQGLRIITWRGIEPVHAPYKNVPTLLADAILPRRKLLEVFHSSVEIVADINARASPHARTQQILGAPTTSIKLDVENHLLAVWRYILQEYLSIDRKDTLVICQKKVEDWLRQKGGLPENVFIEHYYDIAGIDDYKNVALGILVGRPAPGPREIEEIAGALSGEFQPPVPAGMNGFAWYLPVKGGHGIRLTDRGDEDGIRTGGDYHPSEMSEMVRWLYCEGELINAHGRFRAINRTVDNPLAVRWLFNTCLPISVDKVVKWQEPNWTVEAAIEGVVPKQPDELMKLWPDRYQTIDAARWALKDGIWVPPGFLSIEYRFAGTHHNKPGKPRLAYYDPKLIPNPERWLEERLGRKLIFTGRPNVGSG